MRTRRSRNTRASSPVEDMVDGTNVYSSSEEDEVEKFMARKIGGDMDDDEEDESSSEEEVEGVLDVQENTGEVSSTDSSEDEEEEEKEDQQDARIAKIGKKWGSKRSNFFKEGEESDEEEMDELMADEEQLKSEDEAEEEEAKQMKKQLSKHVKRSDFALSDDDSDEEAGGKNNNNNKKKKASSITLTKKSKKRDEKTEKLERVASQAPEVFGLLSELKDNLKMLEDHVGPVLEKVQVEKLSTTNGVSYLEAKYQVMLTYCINIAFYLYLKTQGVSVRDHPVIEQLVRVRTVLDKLKPLDTKLKRQMDEILSGTGKTIAKARSAKPNVNDLMGDEDDDESEEEDEDDDDEDEEEEENGTGQIAKGRYIVPKQDFAPQEFLDDEREEGRRAKEQARLKRKLKKSKMLSELTNEFSGRPEEMPSIGASAEDLENRKIAKERQDYEEEYFVRLRETRKDKAERKKRERNAQAGLTNSLAELEDFGDLEGLVDRVDRQASSSWVNEKTRREQELAKFMNRMDQAARKSKKKISGDEDLKIKDPEELKPLRNRETAMTENEIETIKQKQMAKRIERSTKVDLDEEDEFYKQASKAAKSKKTSRKETYTFPERMHPENAKILKVGEKRKASRQILLNEGLKAHKKKEDRNPRLKRRKKYEQKLKARQGQVMSIRDPSQGDGYGGETTGIRTNLVASRIPNKF